MTVTVIFIFTLMSGCVSFLVTCISSYVALGSQAIVCTISKKRTVLLVLGIAHCTRTTVRLIAFRMNRSLIYMHVAW